MWPASDRIWGYEVNAMKKTLLCRGLVGLPLGVALGQIITLIISACVGDGRYYPVAPELTEAMGGELYAVLLQTALCAVGSGFAMAPSLAMTMSLAIQSGVLLVSCSFLLPIASPRMDEAHIARAGLYRFSCVLSRRMACFVLDAKKIGSLNAHAARGRKQRTDKNGASNCVVFGCQGCALGRNRPLHQAPRRLHHHRVSSRAPAIGL